jgi:aspartyl protease family protein
MKQIVIAFCLLLGASLASAASPAIEVEALFTDAAVITVDGQRKMIRVGDTFQGVTLLAAYSRTATLVYEGEEMVLGISRRIGANYQEPVEDKVTIQRNELLQYMTTAQINGRSVEVLVDTGANVVAMNTDHARKLGVDLKSGKPASVETAGGVVKARFVVLRSVNLGGIKVNNVQASVIDGEFPGTILLGMTYLQHVDIQEENGVLSLTRNW